MGRRASPRIGGMAVGGHSDASAEGSSPSECSSKVASAVGKAAHRPAHGGVGCNGSGTKVGKLRRRQGRLAHQSHHLAVTTARPIESMAKLIHLGIAANAVGSLARLRRASGIVFYSHPRPWNASTAGLNPLTFSGPIALT